MANSFSTFQLKTDSSVLGISEQGGYVTEWKIKNSQGVWMDILYVGTELKRTGIPILFPYYGPSESGMGQHGFARDIKWHLINTAEEGVLLEITQQDISPEIAKYYPYNFKTQIQIQMQDHGFSYTLSVQNTGSKSLPIAPGLHPYWAIPHEQKKQVVAEHYPEIPLSDTDWDSHPLDTEFTFKNPVTVTFPTHQIVIEDTSEMVTKLVVWSQPLSAPDHDFICFEPVTLARKSFDSTPIQVAVGAIWTMKLNFKVIS